MKKKSWKQWVQEYFHFTRTERIAILVLLAGIFLVKIVPGVWTVSTPSAVKIPDSLLIKLAHSDRGDSSFGSPNGFRYTPHKTVSGNGRQLEPVFSGRSKREYGNQYPKPDNPPELFVFNPNLATASEFERLGLPPKTIRTVLNFREKGGRFRNSKDLNKIFGMPEILAARLEPFVQLETAEPALPPLKRSFSTAVAHELTRIDINTADSLDWVKLPGIGPRLSSRILQYREKLGGFMQVSQLTEVYGLQDSVFQTVVSYLELGNTLVRTININQAELRELAEHPYIRWNLAQAIIKYRTNHGRFESLIDLGKLHLVNQELLSKLSPYCKIE